MLPAVRRGRPAYPDVLTPREWEVLALVKEGLTNPQIAQRLGISESGARFHVSEILSKLGVNSRQAAASWREESLRRISFLAALTVRLHGMLGRLALGLLASAFLAFVALGLGVAVMERRAGQEELNARLADAEATAQAVGATHRQGAVSPASKPGQQPGCPFDARTVTLKCG